MKSLFRLCCEKLSDADFQDIISEAVFVGEGIFNRVALYGSMIRKSRLHKEITRKVMRPCHCENKEHNSDGYLFCCYNMHRVSKHEAERTQNMIVEGYWRRGKFYLSADWCPRCLAYNPDTFFICWDEEGDMRFRGQKRCKSCGFWA